MVIPITTMIVASMTISYAVAGKGLSIRITVAFLACFIILTVSNKIRGIELERIGSEKKLPFSTSNLMYIYALILFVLSGVLIAERHIR